MTIDKDSRDAPVHFGASEANAWADGYNAAIDQITPLIEIANTMRGLPEAMRALARVGLHDKFQTIMKELNQ